MVKEEMKMEEIPGNYQDMISQPVVIARQNTLEDEGCVAITSILSKSYEYDDDSDTVIQPPDTILTTIEHAFQTKGLRKKTADVVDSDESELAMHNQTSCNVKDSNNDPSFLFGTTGPISRLALQDACRQQQMTDTA